MDGSDLHYKVAAGVCAEAPEPSGSPVPYGTEPERASQRRRTCEVGAAHVKWGEAELGPRPSPHELPLTDPTSVVFRKADGDCSYYTVVEAVSTPAAIGESPPPLLSASLHRRYYRRF